MNVTLNILFLLFLFLLLLFLFLLFLLHLGRGVGAALLLVLGGVRVAGLLARSLSEPLWQLGCKRKVSRVNISTCLW